MPKHVALEKIRILYRYSSDWRCICWFAELYICLRRKITKALQVCVCVCVCVCIFIYL